MRYARNGPNGRMAGLRRVAIAAATALALVFGVTLVAPAPRAAAQEMWVERAQIVEALAARYDESPSALGITDDGAVLELFQRPGGATWTLVVTLPNGYSRIVAAGEHWMQVPPPAKGHTS